MEEKLQLLFFKELADKAFAKDISIHNAISHSVVVQSFPKVKKGDQNKNNLIFNKLGLVNKNSRSTTHLLESKIKEDLHNGIMPDLTGLNIKDALYILEHIFKYMLLGQEV